MRFSGPWFTLGFCLAYPVVFIFDLPLFVYYPVPGRFELSAATQHPGPVMHWYGLVASAALAGLVTGSVGRTEWLAPRLLAWSILAPLAAMIVIAWELRVFFG